MKLFWYELKKLFSDKVFLISLALLLAVGAVLSLYSIKPQTDKNKVTAIAAKYADSPEQTKAEYDALVQLDASYQYRKMRAEAQGEDAFSDPEVEALLAEKPAFEQFYAHFSYIQSYPQKVKRIAQIADETLQELRENGSDKTSYPYQFQEGIATHYAITSRIQLPDEYASGWDVFLGFDVFNLVILLFIVIAAPIVVMGDISVGATQILHCTKKGRTRLASAKLAVAFFLSTFAVLLFSLIPLVVVGYKSGYSSLLAPIQSFEAYAHCPYPLTVLAAVLLSLLVKIMVFAVLTLLVMLFAVGVKRYPLTFLLSLLYCGGQYLISIQNYVTQDIPVRFINLFTAAEAKTLFERYRLLRFSGFNLQPFTAILIVFFLVALICGVFIILLHNRTKGVRKQKRFLRIKLPAPYLSYRMKSVFGYETYKLFFASKMILLVVVFMVVKVFLSAVLITPPTSNRDRIYKHYMTILAGEATPEKEKFIRDRRQEIDRLVAEKTQVEAAYKEGTMRYEEYAKKIRACILAELEQKHFELVENQLDYVNRKAAEGESIHYVYDTGWKHFLLADFDLLLCGLLIFLFCGIFNEDVQILRTTKLGRQRTFYAKLWLLLISATVLFIFFNCIDLYRYLAGFDLPNIDSPLASMPEFTKMRDSVTIRRFICAFYAIKYIGTLALTLLIFNAAQFSRKLFLVVIMGVSLTYFPYMLTLFGVDAAYYVSLGSLLDGSHFWRLFPGTKYTLILPLTVLFLLFAALAIFSTRRSKKLYCD